MQGKYEKQNFSPLSPSQPASLGLEGPSVIMCEERSAFLEPPQFSFQTSLRAAHPAMEGNAKSIENHRAPSRRRLNASTDELYDDDDDDNIREGRSTNEREI